MIASFLRDSEIADIVQKAQSGERITDEDALRLLETSDIHALMHAADAARKRKAGDRVAFSVYLHLNYTNLCDNACPLCAFYRSDKDSDAYLMPVEEAKIRVEHAIQHKEIEEVHIVGGINMKASFQYATRLIETIRSLSGSLFIKAFTAVEIAHFAKQENKPYSEILSALKEAGVNGLPGGGAEIFSENVRSKIAPSKIGGKEWLEVHRAAHRLGLFSNATMLYGHFETPEDIVNHLRALRDLQDETKGLQAFIPLPFHPENTEFQDTLFSTDGLRDARVFALSRLYLDNIPHIKVHWPAFGLKFAQFLLSCGADDLGGTAFDEKVFHEAGARNSHTASSKTIETLIREIGRIPLETDSSYQYD